MTSSPKRTALRLEKKAAKRHRGKARPNSGSCGAKGDFTSGDRFLGEHKHTSKGSYSIKLREVLAHAKNATREGKDWIFLIEFLDHFERNQRFVLVDENVFLELLESS